MYRLDAHQHGSHTIPHLWSPRVCSEVEECLVDSIELYPRKSIRVERGALKSIILSLAPAQLDKDNAWTDATSSLVLHQHGRSVQ